MSDRAVYVYVELSGKPVFVGTLYARFRKNRESATFTYEASWLSHPSRFALEPALVLHDLAHHTHTGQAMFGAFGDSAPDRWGRMLMRRAERQRAKAEKRPPRTVNEIDCLLGVNDETRQGALRFAEQLGGPFVTVTGDGARVPPLVELPALLAASNRFAADEDDDDDLRLLLAPGSSLGGARPKASVRDHDNRLLIAKFPHPGDETNQPAWEALALRLASSAGINASVGRLNRCGPVGAIGAVSIGWASPYSLFVHDELAWSKRYRVAQLPGNCRRLRHARRRAMFVSYGRIVLRFWISNVDDHLQSRSPLGRPSRPATGRPMTQPDAYRYSVLSLAVDDQDQTASLELALQVAAHFGIADKTARRIAKEAGQAVVVAARARRLGIREPESTAWHRRLSTRICGRRPTALANVCAPFTGLRFARQNLNLRGSHRPPPMATCLPTR